MPRSVVVAIAEPHASYAAALATFIGDEPELLLAGTADHVDRLVALVLQRGVEVAVIAARLPGGGIDRVARHLRRSGSPCRLLMVASVLTPSTRRTAASARAALVERSDGRRLLAALTGAAH